jgi:hypothetical protein
MKQLIISIVLLCLASSSSVLIAAEPNPNGFPSGTHYNLNIIGKSDSFMCPAQEYDEYGNPVYGNVVFVPENGEGAIYLVSGKGRKAAAVTELQATDPCAFDRDGATVKLPPNGNGYRVYARVLAKPTNEPSIGLFSSLYMAQDELGNDLIYLGLVTETGFETPTMTFTRKPGKSTAVDISGMFHWSGSVCYFSQPEGSFTLMNICCTDANSDGVYEACLPPAEVEPVCGTGYSLIQAYCTSYTDEWIFNIADYVAMLMATENKGVKLLQIRFYPN